MSLHDLRPNQEFALSETDRLLSEGVRHWCVTSPTGAGKSLWMILEMDRAARAGKRVEFITHRKLVMDQVIAKCQELQIPFGTRSSSHDREHADDNALVQLVMPLTEAARIKTGKRSAVPEADVVIVDEAHGMVSGVTRKLIQSHDQHGAIVIESTATPVGLHKFCSELVVAGTNSEMRKIGALLPAKVYDPGCPNLDKVKRVAQTNEFNQTQLRKSGYVQSIYASVVDELKAKNPDLLPFILFAPGVDESKWFVDQLARHGIDAVHIDGESVYRNGKAYDSSNAAREDALNDVRYGRCHGVCNRFVMREGIDLVELYYCAIATPMGSLTSYIQSVGRVLRAHASMDHVVVADHGGNARRHGSPNTDWDWRSMWKLTPTQIEAVRLDDLKKGRKDTGTSCPGCGRMYAVLPDVCECGKSLEKAYACPECGHCHKEWPFKHECKACGADMRKIRRKPVIQHDGSLAFVKDSAFTEKPAQHLGERTQKMWDGIFWSARKNRKNRSFGQCKAWFIKRHIEEFHCRPPLDLPRMPKNPADWSRRVSDVPFQDLIDG